MDDLRKAQVALQERRIVTLTPVAGVLSIVELVAGGPIRGSWWSHPKAHAIYATAAALEEAPDVLTLKLVQGKVTFVHRSLWPELLCFATDARRWTAMVTAIGAPARRLLEEIVHRGEVHLVAPRPSKKALERRLLCISTSEHTPSGRHETVLRSWRHWAAPDVRRAAEAFPFDLARTSLLEACRDLGDADPHAVARSGSQARGAAGRATPRIRA